jgi:hypothetical protein
MTVTDDPRNDPNMVSVPFIFVGHGDPLPVQWMAEHPDYIKVPAVMVPHGTRPPPPWGDAGVDQMAAARGAGLTAEPRIPGSFVPPPARQKRMWGGQPWPKDRNGGDWPKDRWGRPTRPLWDYPPGVRAPGEGGAPGAGSIGTEKAIRAARTALAALDQATSRAFLASDRTETGNDGTQAPARGVASRYPGAYDVAQAGQGEETGRGARQPHLTPAQQAAIVAAAQHWSNSNVPYVKGGKTIQGADCSGAVYGIYREAGINIKYESTEDFRGDPQFSPVTGGPEIGDVGWYKGHVVIYGGTTATNKDVWSASLPGGPDSGPAGSPWYGKPQWYRYNGTQQKN